jgi:hypothetical protein
MFTDSVPISKKKHHITMTMISWLMLFGEITSVCSENRMKLIRTLCGQNPVLLITEADGTYCYHRAIKGEI